MGNWNTLSFSVEEVGVEMNDGLQKNKLYWAGKEIETSVLKEYG
jgi:hypothetical protein